MANFGWSYPPGCSGTPWDEPAGPCEVCGQDVDAELCICPECPECGTVGDPNCYIEHGLRRTEEQKFLLECAKREWERDFQHALEVDKAMTESILDEEE